MTHPALIERITRSLAYMLRHQPEQFDLELDEYGYADLDDVVQALNERLGEPVEEDDVREAVESGDRVRYEINADRIRALYGHSIDVKPGEPAKPPALLYVGVSSGDADRVRRYGLRAGRRSFLHLALTPEDALETGRRTARDYVVITVRALDAWEEGINFYDRQSLFLSDPVPTHFLEVGDVHSDGRPARDDESGERGHGDSGDRGRRGGRSRRERGGPPGFGRAPQWERGTDDRATDERAAEQHTGDERTGDELTADAHAGDEHAGDRTAERPHREADDTERGDPSVRAPREPFSPASAPPDRRRDREHAPRERHGAPVGEHAHAHRGGRGHEPREAGRRDRDRDGPRFEHRDARPGAPPHERPAHDSRERPAHESGGRPAQDTRDRPAHDTRERPAQDPRERPAPDPRERPAHESGGRGEGRGQPDERHREPRGPRRGERGDRGDTGPRRDSHREAPAGPRERPSESRAPAAPRVQESPAAHDTGSSSFGLGIFEAEEAARAARPPRPPAPLPRERVEPEKPRPAVEPERDDSGFGAGV